MARSSKCGGCCLIMVIIIIAAIVGGSIYVSNMTLAKLGLGDKEIFEGQTINSLGLGDIKIKDIFSFLRNLRKPDEDSIVDKPFDPVTEAAAAGSNLQNALNVPLTEDGGIDFATLLENNVVYNEKYLILYHDTTFAYITNTFISQKMNESAESGEDDEDAQMFKNINANVAQISIYPEGSAYKLKIVFKADMSFVKDKIKEQTGNQIPAFVINTIPSALYFTAISTLTADESGKLAAVNEDVVINNAVMEGVTNLIFAAIGNGNPDESKSKIGDAMARAFVETVAQLGYVGTATADANGLIQSDATINLGAEGIADGGLYLITYTQDSLPVEEE